MPPTTKDLVLAKIVTDTTFHIRRISGKANNTLFDLPVKAANEGDKDPTGEISVGLPVPDEISASVMMLSSQGWVISKQQTNEKECTISVQFHPQMREECSKRFDLLKTALDERDLELRLDSSVCRKHIRCNHPSINKVLKHVETVTKRFKTKQEKLNNQPQPPAEPRRKSSPVAFSVPQSLQLT
jgi:hypothetical protein